MDCKKGSINHRIEQLVDVFAKGNNSKFASIVNTSEANIRNYLSGRQPKFEIITSIIEKLEISYEWILTGRGPMLRNGMEGEGSANTSQALGKAQVEPRKAQSICISCNEKERVIQMYQKQTEALERQIEDLKSNLERLIASKDAMLLMKEEAIKGKEATLAAKDEIISIQSKRIAELESHRETEDLKKILGSVGKIGEENTPLPNIQPETLSTKTKRGAYQP